MKRLTILRTKRGKLIDEMDALLIKASAEKRDLTEEEQAAYKAKAEEISALAPQITREEELMELKAASAIPVPDQEAPVTRSPRIEVNPAGTGTVQREPGIAVGLIVMSIAAGKRDLRRAAHFAETRLMDTEIAKALAASDAEAGGFIVPANFRAELIEYLRPLSAVRSLNPTVIPLTNGTASIPKVTGGATAAYLGENKNISKTEETFGLLKLTERKLAALVPISNDLVRHAAFSAAGIVRDDLAAALAQKSDLEFIRGDGTGAGPKGLRYWCPAANRLTVNATVNLANVTVDLGRLILALENSDVRMIRPGWIMAPRTKNYLMTVRDGNGNFAFRSEMLVGRLWGYPFGVTTQIPINLAVTGTAESEVYFADFADVIIGEDGTLEIDVSDVAAYHDGSNVVAAFSQDQTVIRAIDRHDFGMRHDASVAVLTDVDWT